MFNIIKLQKPIISNDWKIKLFERSVIINANLLQTINLTPVKETVLENHVCIC